MAYNDDELDALTPEERAGLEDDGDENLTGQDDDDEQEGDESGADANDQQDDDQDESDDEGDDDAADDQDDQGDDDADDDGAAGRDDGQPADEQGQEEADEPAVNPDRLVIPEFTVKEPENVEERTAALDKREDDLSEKFEDGDLSTAEYRKQLRELTKERDQLNRDVLRFESAKDRHEEAVSRAKQDYEQNWYRAAEAFVKDHPEVSRNQTVMRVFDELVKAVNTGENLDKYSHQARLEMAYQRWAEDLGIEVQPKTKGKEKDAKPKTKQRADLPPTLSRVPSAQVQETDTGKYGNLTRLMNSSNPHEVARAHDLLAQMPEAEQQRYLAMNE